MGVLAISCGHNLIRNGFHTAMLPGKFAFTQNTSFWAQPPQERLKAIADGGKGCFLYAMRSLVLQSADWKSLVANVTDTKWCCQHNFSIVGERDACVVSTRTMQPPKIQYLDPAAGHWFIIQTNDDWWECSMDCRREKAVRHLTNMGRAGMSEDTMLAVLQQYGVCSEMTDFTCSCTPSSGNSWRFVDGKEIKDKTEKDAYFNKTAWSPPDLRVNAVKFFMGGGVKSLLHAPKAQIMTTWCLGPCLMMCAKQF